MEDENVINSETTMPASLDFETMMTTTSSEPMATTEPQPMMRLSTETGSNKEPMVTSTENHQAVTTTTTENNTEKPTKMEVEETEPETRKRAIEEDLQPVLIRLPSDSPSCGSSCIRINKDEVLHVNEVMLLILKMSRY